MSFISLWHIIFMHASDALAKKKYSNFDGLSFWLQNGYLLKLIFVHKEQLRQRERKNEKEKYEKSLLHLQEFPHVFSPFRNNFCKFCLWILHVKLRTRTKGIEFPYHLNSICQNAPPPPPLESINLIKSDSITGNLNPCWMKFSWRKDKREKGDFKWIMKQFMQKAFFGKSILLQ